MGHLWKNVKSSDAQWASGKQFDLSIASRSSHLLTTVEAHNSFSRTVENGMAVKDWATGNKLGGPPGSRGLIQQRDLAGRMHSGGPLVLYHPFSTAANRFGERVDASRD